MSFISLKIPTLVQNIEVEEVSHYYLRPLFLGYPLVHHRRFELAVARFKKEIKNIFIGFELNRSNAGQLLWYLFNPEIEYRQYHYDITISKQFISGNFGLAICELQGLTFVCLPTLNNFMFIAKNNKPGNEDIREQCKEVIANLLKKFKKQQGADFIPDTYFSAKREFITVIELKINIGHGQFKFEQTNNNWVFSLINQQADFNGALEIEKVGFDLNSYYPSQLARAFYQDELAEKLVRIIFQPENTPIALVGPEGVGKHTVVHEAVWRYMDGKGERGKGRTQRIWHIDPTRIIAGMSIIGMWQKRFESIIQYVRKPEEQAKSSDKMLIDKPVALLRIGKSTQNNLTLSDVLKSYLEKRQLQLIILATPEEWKIMQEKDRRFSDLFQVFRLYEPGLETATSIILQQRKVLELENDAVITIQAINQLLAIQRNYLKNKPLPGSVMKMMKQLATKYRFSKIDAPEVREEFKAFSGLEERIFDSSRQFEKDEVHNIIAQELVGQPKAVDTLANVVHLIKAKLSDKSKPVSSFLFIGPTGVGKTQAAKVLCNYLMGSEDHLMRFDMNEFIDEYAIQRLIGDYYNPEGQLTGKVRYRPFGVILFDEIEKAHPKVHDILLQVLDDGRLTDSLGRTVDFSNTIIIMTSNVGSRQASSQLGYDTKSKDEAAIYRKAVENHFRPEFINRIDQIVIFNALELDHILSIARLQIKELLQRDGFVRRTTILNITKDALEWVAKRGFDAKMGGRALKRQIERDLTTLTAEQLISSYSDNPIIFEILLDNDRLRPRIHNLDFAEPLEENWLPELPDVNKGRRFYGQLLRKIEKLEDRIMAFEEGRKDPDDDSIIKYGREQDWLSFHFKDKLGETKEDIKNLMLGFSDHHFSVVPAIPLRLKSGQFISKKDWGNKGMRENLKDRLFQKEALKEISEAYLFAKAQFDSIKTEFIENYVNVALLKLFSKGFFASEPGRVVLQVESCITGLGKWETSFLLDRYIELFKHLDISHTVARDKKSITAEEYSLVELLKGEEGIHLFYVAHQNPLPVKLTLQTHNGKAGASGNYNVIRIYDGSNTLTDLRTGFTNAVYITPNEFKVLLYAGIDKEIRRRLL